MKINLKKNKLKLLIFLFFIFSLAFNFFYQKNKENFDNNFLKQFSNLTGIFNANSVKGREFINLVDNSSNKIGGIVRLEKKLNNHKTITGSVNTSIKLDPKLTSDLYTVISLARYNDGKRDRIIAASNKNWLSGHHAGKTGVAYHEGWLNEKPIEKYSWVLSVSSPDLYKANLKTYNGGKTTLHPHLTINGGVHSGGSDWELAELITFNDILSMDDIKKIESYLAYKYNLPFKHELEKPKETEEKEEKTEEKEEKTEEKEEKTEEKEEKTEEKEEKTEEKEGGLNVFFIVLPNLLGIVGIGGYIYYKKYLKKSI